MTMTTATKPKDWQTEAERVAALIASDQADRHERDIALLDPDGERRFVRPPAQIAERRRIAANGMSEAECTDTIGKLWAHGLLDGGRYAPDLLRDAGRRYAAAYWFRYGKVCASISAYADIIRVSGSKTTFIADAAVDERVEAHFRARDNALRDARAKRAVDLVCVDSAGDNDPGWLINLMVGYPAETREQRMTVLICEQEVLQAKKGPQLEKAERKLLAAKRRLSFRIKELRAELLPHATVAIIRDGLSALADVDRADGLHRPKRPRKSEEDD
jgi:hypothetical protein